MDLSDSYKILQGMVYDMANSQDGISTGEIVAKYGISRRLVPKYINILSSAGVPVYTERKRHYLVDGYRTAFILTAEESEFLYLALERSLIHHSDRWFTIQSLLHKLGSKMPVPLADYLVGKLDPDSSGHKSDKWFTVLAKAKRRRYEVWVEYHPLNRPHTTRWLIRPFRFVTNPLSDGLYVLCEGTQDKKTYIPLSLKFDRILHVEPTNHRYEIADAARLVAQEGQAWGVWYSDRESSHVALRFEPRHYDRLLESVWHPTQQITVDERGYVLFSVDVSEPQEMVPWIRSWGSGVVVLEPEELRRRMLRSLQLQLQAYGLESVQSEKENLLAYLWAKYDRKSGIYHLLIYHLLDVAAVAWQMWDVLSTSQQNWLADLLDLGHDATRRLLASLVGLHDIGKATPGFQIKARPLFDQLITAGMPDDHPFDVPHGISSAVILHKLLAEHGANKREALQIAMVLGGHHGEWITEPHINN